MIIYEIVCNITGERYIGSTKQKLNQRMWSHKRTNDPSRKHYCSSKQIIARGDYRCNIIEEGECGREREQYYLDTLPNINRIRADGHKPRDKIRTAKTSREWRDKNIEKIRRYDTERNKRSWIWEKSWGGCRKTNNNLLNISMDLFH